MKDSVTYGLSNQIYQEMVATIQGESSWNIFAHNNISKGIAEFTNPTWRENCTKFGSINDPKAQLECMTMLVSEGQFSRWDVWCLQFGKSNLQCQKRGL